MTLGEMWNRLLEIGVCEQALQIVTDINGYSEQTLLDVLYSVTGYRDFEQFEQFECYE